VVGDPQVEVQENVLDSYSDRLSELTVRLNGLARVTPCGLGVKRSTVVGDPRLEFQQNILDSHSDRLSELTVRLNGLAGDCGAWGLSTQLVGETPGWNSNSCLWEVFSSRKCPHLIMSLLSA